MFEDLIGKGCVIKEEGIVRDIGIIEKIEDCGTYKVYAFSSDGNGCTYVSKINGINHENQIRNENRSCDIIELTIDQKNEITNSLLESLNDYDEKRFKIIKKLNYPALK